MATAQGSALTGARDRALPDGAARGPRLTLAGDTSAGNGEQYACLSAEERGAEVGAMSGPALVKVAGRAYVCERCEVDAGAVTLTGQLRERDLATGERLYPRKTLTFPITAIESIEWREHVVTRRPELKAARAVNASHGYGCTSMEHATVRELARPA
jgi:hypothetical protein